MNDFKYIFKDDFKFGDQKADSISLRAPSMKHKKIVARIQHAVSLANAEFATKLKDFKREDVASSSNTDDIEPAAYLISIQSYHDEKLYLDCCEAFIELMISEGISKLNENIPLTGRAWIERMSNKDFDNIMGLYIQNFFMPSK